MQLLVCVWVSVGLNAYINTFMDSMYESVYVQYLFYEAKARHLALCLFTARSDWQNTAFANFQGKYAIAEIHCMWFMLELLLTSVYSMHVAAVWLICFLTFLRADIKVNWSGIPRYSAQSGGHSVSHSVISLTGCAYVCKWVCVRIKVCVYQST